MSQIDILDFLEKNKEKWFHGKEIFIACGILSCNGSKSLRKLREYEEIRYKQAKGEKNERFLYRYKKIKDII